MNNFAIEKGIPIPPDARMNNSPSRRYPFQKMAVGDSFLMDRPPAIAASCAAYFAKRMGAKFITRKIDADHTRVWRIS